MTALVKIPYMPDEPRNQDHTPGSGGLGVAEAAPSPMELKRLWDSVQADDANAFEQVYKACSGSIFGLCLRMTANQAAAEDCTQATFIQAWEKRAGFRGESALKTWLHRIAVNAVLGRGRSEGRMREVLADYAEVVMAEQVFIAQAKPAAEDRDLERAIAALPERGRQVFVLHAIHGYKHNEVGQMMGIAAGTSKAHYHRARELLQSALNNGAEFKADGVEQ